MAKFSKFAVIVIFLSTGIAVYQNHAQLRSLPIVQGVVAGGPSRLLSTLGLKWASLTDSVVTNSKKDAAGSDEVNSCQMKGNVVDCSCSYAAVEKLNRDEIAPLLDELVQLPFFRYFKVDLYCDCPLWPDDGMCSMRDCSVCECEDHEVPRSWLEAEEKSRCDAKGAAAEDASVDRTLQPEVRQHLLAIPDWRGYRNPWMPEADDAGVVDYSYINLRRNPERYTGYAGAHAARVWGAIYEQPALKADRAAVPELRVFYRLISGVHASISAHLCADYLLDKEARVWGPNLAEFERRLGTPAVRDRVENLYFAYLFVLRATMKAAPLLRDADFETGSPAEDARAAQAMRTLVAAPELEGACPIPFDEGRLWRGEEAADLRDQLRATFRNMTQVMDCVGCEKCKMWGKLQFLGLATSLKVLFSDDGAGGPGAPPLQLERNEVIALVNLLERLSKSVETVRTLSLQLAGDAEGKQHAQGLGAIQDVVQGGIATGPPGQSVAAA